jgi:hypothetical protein
MTDHSATGGTSSSSACNNGHIFIYAGDPPIPDVYRCQCGATTYRKPFVTSDPQAPYERKPMLSDAEVDRMWHNDMFELGERRGSDGYVLPSEDYLFEEGYRFGMKQASKFYEAKIKSGELIRRDELVEWLDDQLRQAKEDGILRTSGLNAESAVLIQLQLVLDHINKKP